MALRWRIGPVDSKPIHRTRPKVGHVSVPNFIRELRKLDPLELFLSRAIEQAELHLGRVSREKGEIYALRIPRSASRVRLTFANLKALGENIGTEHGKVQATGLAWSTM